MESGVQIGSSEPQVELGTLLGFGRVEVSPPGPVSVRLELFDRLVTLTLLTTILLERRRLR